MCMSLTYGKTKTKEKDNNVFLWVTWLLVPMKWVELAGSDIVSKICVNRI